jgi:hypothetical protein
MMPSAFAVGQVFELRSSREMVVGFDDYFQRPMATPAIGVRECGHNRPVGLGNPGAVPQDLVRWGWEYVGMIGVDLVCGASLDLECER